MILANFDLSFFTTIPGMLITGGVLLLLIALIIFIATGSKKDKKKKKEENTESATTAVSTPEVNNEVSTVEATPSTSETPIVANVESTNPTVTPEPPVLQSEPVTIVDNNSPATQPTVDAIEQPAIAEEAPQVTSTPSVEMVEPTPQVSNTPTPVVNPEVAPDQPPVMVTPTVNIPDTAQETTSALDNAPVINVVSNEKEPEVKQEEEKPIYGGVTPVIPKIDVGEEHRPIYGGASPLENTGAIPTINNLDKQTITPNIKTIDEQPKVEPVTVNVPQVEVPTVETTQVEVPKQEEVTPVITESIPKVDTTPTAPKQDDEIESLF